MAEHNMADPAAEQAMEQGPGHALPQQELTSMPSAASTQIGRGLAGDLAAPSRRSGSPLDAPPRVDTTDITNEGTKHIFELSPNNANLTKVQLQSIPQDSFQAAISVALETRTIGEVDPSHTRASYVTSKHAFVCSVPKEYMATIVYLACQGPITVQTGHLGPLTFTYKMYTEQTDAPTDKPGRSNRFGFIRVGPGCEASLADIQRATADHISKFNMEMSTDIKAEEDEPGAYKLRFNTVPSGDPWTDIDHDTFHRVTRFQLQGHPVKVWLKAWVDETFPMLCKHCHKRKWEGRCPDGCEKAMARDTASKGGGKRSTSEQKKADKQERLKRLKDKARSAGAGSSGA